MAIVTDDLKLRLDFTTDKILLKRTLDSLETKWDRNIEFDSLLAVLNEMFDEENRQRIVIFQGDGAQIIWLKDSPYPVSYSTLEKSGLRYRRGKAFANYGFTDVKEAIERSRATIYSIVLGVRFVGLSKQEQVERARITLTDLSRFWGWKNLKAVIEEYQWREVETKTAGQTAMFKIADLSGGIADFIERPEDAGDVYANIFTVIKNRYLIGYYPTNRNRDGKLRAVSVQVRNHPEFIVTSRNAYLLR